MLYGYKCFDKGLVNRYGVKFQVGKLYHIDNDIVFGVNGNGFHMCINLEDTLRFFDAFVNEVEICRVICFGKCNKSFDDYNEFYDMYACEYMYIEKKLSREEIIDYMLLTNENRVKRFISLFKLNQREQQLFRDKFKNSSSVLDQIEFYQNNKKDVFVRKLLNEKQ